MKRMSFKKGVLYKSFTFPTAAVVNSIAIKQVKMSWKGKGVGGGGVTDSKQ